MSETTLSASAEVIDNSINTSITQTNIIINGTPGASRRGPQAHGHHTTPHHDGQAKAGPVTGGAIAPTVFFASDGDKLTTYLAKDGASATFREDRQDNGAVSLTLQDASGKIITHGDHRGYDAYREDRNGGSAQDHVLVDGKWGGVLAKGSDRIECTTASHGVNITPSVSDQVTLDQLQQFGGRHPQLRDTLRGVTLPVTVVGGKQIGFGEALQHPTNYEGCPVNSNDAIRRK
jgi:hypothetical protein